MTRQLQMVWDNRYRTEAAPLTSTTKQFEVATRLIAENIVHVQRVPSLRNGWPEIKVVHDPTYVEAVRTGTPRERAESQGFRWSPAFAAAVHLQWNGHVRACELALSYGAVLHPVSGAHHAGYRRGMGFCTFNYLVGAPRVLKAQRVLSINRVLNIDLDAHYGDGTDTLTEHDPDVFHFDIAIGKQNAKICPRGMWADVTTWKQYREYLNVLPGTLDMARPDLVQYQAGMDVYELDPLGGVEGMGAAQIRERDRFVFKEVLSRGIPLVVTLAGGYVPDVTVGLHVQTGRDLYDAINATVAV